MSEADQMSGDNIVAMAEAADAAVSEAAGDPRAVTFGTGSDAVTLSIPRKWKRFKFMRALSRGDIGAALEAIWQPTKGEDGELVDHPALQQLDELDIAEDEFAEALDKIARAMGGVKAGN